MTPVFALVCEELPERAAACRAHLREQGVNAIFWRGFHGKTWGLQTVLEYEPGERLPPGHVGLNLGAYAMWQAAYVGGDPNSPYPAHDDDPYVFLEDDAVLPPNFPVVLTDLQIQLRYEFPDWDLVFLGLAETEPHVWQKVTGRIGKKPNTPFCVLDEPFGTHAMMIRRRALPVLLENMRAAERNLDQQLWRRVLSKKLLKWCAVLPSLVEQRTFDHRRVGKPEWGPSTLDPDAPQKPKLQDHGDELPGRPSAWRYAATTALIDPYPCIYRGDALDDPARAADGRSVAVSLCANLNTPCHSKDPTVPVSLDETPCRPCGTCELRLAMPDPAPRPKLALPDGHFNPSIALWDGKLILATRDSWGHSRVALWELRNAAPDWTGEWTAAPIASYASEHPDAPRLEDPRLFVAPHDGKMHLCAMFNLPDKYPPKVVRVGYVRFARDLSGIEDTVLYESPYGNKYEKNWVPFADNGGLNWVYATAPEHVVYQFTQHGHATRQVWRTPNPLPWTAGVIRGGAAPVLMPGPEFPEYSYRHGGSLSTYYHFFHGCMKRIQGSVYTVGCAVFEAEPPYRVIRQTLKPLFWPDLPALGEDVVKRYVLWPGGAVPFAGAWHLALGVDDTNCRMVRLPFADLEAALNDVPEKTATVSIRDTEVARGFVAPEDP